MSQGVKVLRGFIMDPTRDLKQDAALSCPNFHLPNRMFEQSEFVPRYVALTHSLREIASRAKCFPPHINFDMRAQL